MAPTINYCFRVHMRCGLNFTNFYKKYHYVLNKINFTSTSHEEGGKLNVNPQDPPRIEGIM